MEASVFLQESIEFWTFRDPAASWVLLASVLLGGIAGAVGCITFLQKRSLIGDALAHSALPGVTTGFILFSSRDPLFVYIGAILSCLLAAFCIVSMKAKTKIKDDSALAIVLSVFFAIGVFQLTIIQKNPLAAQAGIENLLFGKAAAMTKDDIKVLAGVSFLVFSFLVIFYQKIKILIFDSAYFQARGLGRMSIFGISLGENFFQKLLWLLIVVTIITGLQLAGVVLVAAMVLTPAAASRFWSNSLLRMFYVSALFGSISGALGAYISYLSPAMPTGPWMVVVASFIFFISAVFAPRHGYLSRILGRIRLKTQTREENILRTLFKIGEEEPEECPSIAWSQVARIRDLQMSRLKKSMSELAKQGFLFLDGEECRLSPTGLARAVQLTRFHRLWELYLTQEIKAPADHVHEDAEEVEHVITSEIESSILESLKDIESDPHGRPIPEKLEIED